MKIWEIETDGIWDVCEGVEREMENGEMSHGGERLEKREEREERRERRRREKKSRTC